MTVSSGDPLTGAVAAFRCINGTEFVRSTIKTRDMYDIKLC